MPLNVYEAHLDKEGLKKKVLKEVASDAQAANNVFLYCVLLPLLDEGAKREVTIEALFHLQLKAGDMNYSWFAVCQPVMQTPCHLPLYCAFPVGKYAEDSKRPTRFNNWQQLLDAIYRGFPRSMLPSTSLIKQPDGAGAEKPGAGMEVDIVRGLQVRLCYRAPDAHGASSVPNTERGEGAVSTPITKHAVCPLIVMPLVPCACAWQAGSRHHRQLQHSCSDTRVCTRESQVAV